MEDPFTPVRNFLLSLSNVATIDSEHIRFYNSFIDDATCKVHFEPQYHQVYPPKIMAEFANLAEAYINKSQWTKDAERQIYIAEVKKAHSRATPQTYEEKLHAVTIRPDSGDHNTMLQILELLKTVSCINGYRAVIEQCSVGDEDPKGWHVHLAVDSKFAPSKVKQYIKQKIDSRFVAITHVTKGDVNFQDHYMSGNKGTNPLKVARCLKDTLLRTQLGLEVMYEYKKNLAEE